MRRLLGDGAEAAEHATIAGRSRLLALAQETGDPVVAGLTLHGAAELLAQGLKRLPELAKDLVERPRLDVDALRLVLDHDDDEEELELRPRLGGNGAAPAEAAATPLSDLLVPLELDALTVDDDDRFVKALKQEPNLPPQVAAHVADLF
jgi:hypothetical protein